jgi:hypothetical protein
MPMRFIVPVGVEGVLLVALALFASGPAAAAPTAAEAQAFVAKAETELAADNDFQRNGANDGFHEAIGDFAGLNAGKGLSTAAASIATRRLAPG